MECNVSTAIMYGDDFRYGIDRPVGAPELAEAAKDGNPNSSAVHLKERVKLLDEVIKVMI